MSNKSNRGRQKAFHARMCNASYFRHAVLFELVRYLRFVCTGNGSSRKAQRCAIFSLTEKRLEFLHHVVLFVICVKFGNLYFLIGVEIFEFSIACLSRLQNCCKFSCDWVKVWSQYSLFLALGGFYSNLFGISN